MVQLLCLCTALMLGGATYHHHQSVPTIYPQGETVSNDSPVSPQMTLFPNFSAVVDPFIGQ